LAVVTKTKNRCYDRLAVRWSNFFNHLAAWKFGNLIRELHAQTLTTPEIRERLAAGKTSTGEVVEMNLDMIRRRLSKINLKAGKYSVHQLQMLQKIAELDREGRSFASIAHYLNEHGFTSASGKSWNRGMVAHLLYGTGRKRESLENIGEHSLSGNHRSSGTRARLP
jgi:Recombinase